MSEHGDLVPVPVHTHDCEPRVECGIDGCHGVADKYMHCDLFLGQLEMQVHWWVCNGHAVEVFDSLTEMQLSAGGPLPVWRS